MPTPEQFDQATIALVYALRDSLTDSVSRLDFWQERCRTAIETAAAGSETASQAITTACRKLQIDNLALDAGKKAIVAAQIIDTDYPGWAAHIHRNIVYIIALARLDNAEKKAAKRAEKAADIAEGIF